MSEINQNLPPTLRSAMGTFYTAPQPDPAFAEGLEARLRQRQIELMVTAPIAASSKQKPGFLLPTNRSSFMHMLRTRPILAVVAAILALLLLTGIAYAVGRLSGYIPGIGFINNVQSILETPVVATREIPITPTSGSSSKANTTQTIPTLTAAPGKVTNPSLSSHTLPVVEKKGITVTVEQVVSESGRLVIAYKITGLPVNYFGPERVPTLQAFVEAHPDEPIQEQVQLHDGTLLEHGRGGGGNCQGGGDLASSWLSCQSIYAPLPQGVNQFTFQIHRLQNALPDELPEDWNFSIRLTSGDSSWSASGVEEPNLSSQKINGITLKLRKIDRSSAPTAFQLGLEWEGQNRMLRNMDPITLHDDQGHVYTLESGHEGDHWSPDQPNIITFASMLTNLADSTRPLTFRLNGVVMTATDQFTLHFDPGKDAKIGQEWPMDQTIQAGVFDLHVSKARLKNNSDGLSVIEFDVQAPPNVIEIPLFAEGSTSSGSEYDQTLGIWRVWASLPALPAKPLDLSISQVQYQVNGPWEITWQP